MSDTLSDIIRLVAEGEEAIMKVKPSTKLIHEGEYVAEVDVNLITSDDEWLPYLSLEDAYKLDDVRVALRNGDLETASQKAQIFRLTPVAI
jgi:hypothetical protein